MRLVSTMAPSGKRARALAAGVVLLLVPVLAIGVAVARDTQAAKPAAAAANKYIGAEKCKSCHDAAGAGSQYATWKKTEHAKAWERLASPEAKESGKKSGVEDPQKSDKCLKCHTTAFGVAAEDIKKGFDPKGGVQCEACHGPGELHMKARFAAAAAAEEESLEGAVAEYKQIPEGEIITKVDEKTCLACHNKESPNYKPFCFCESFAKIRHRDPRIPGGDKREYTCSCEKCKAANNGQPGKCTFADEPAKK